MKSPGNKILLTILFLSVVHCFSTSSVAQACNCAKKYEAIQERTEDRIYKEKLFCEAPKEWLLAYGSEDIIEENLNTNKPCGCGCNNGGGN